MFEEIYKTICRLCLKQRNNETMASLIDDTSDDGLSSYGKSVLNFANISIKKDDFLPTMICKNCVVLLKHAIRFKLTCESSHCQLELLKKQSLNSEKRELNLKEKVVEYAIFNQYFPEESDFKPIGQNDSCNQSKPCNSDVKVNKIKCDKIKNKQSNLSASFVDIKPEQNTNEYSTNFDFEDENIDSQENITTISSQPASLEDIILRNLDILSVNCKNLSESEKLKNNNHSKKLKLKRQKNIKDDKNTEIGTRTPEASYRKKTKNKGPFVCELCEKVLSNRVTYRNHLERHNNNFRFICEHCGRGFPTKAELTIHLVAKHGTGYSFECDHCGFKAPRKLEFIEHIRLHTGERPFTCDKCGLTFRRHGIWRKHLIYHGEKTVHCDQCPKKFYRKSEMLAHANNVHERLYVYLCTMCGATYAKTSSVRRHLTEKHGIPRESQGKIVRVLKGKDMEFPEQ